MILGHSELPLVVGFDIQLYAQGYQFHAWAYPPKAMWHRWLPPSICRALAERSDAL